MSQYTSYYLYQKYEKRGEQDWIPVYPNVYSVDGDGTMPLSAKTENDPACGYTPVIEPIYRWVNMNITSNWICDDCPVQPIYRWDVLSPSIDYICYNGDKYYKEVYQVSYDNGNSWSNVIPEEYERGPLYEVNSDDCFTGYSFVFKYFDTSATSTATCEQTTEITSAYTSSRLSAITSVFVGSCVTAIGNKAFARSGTSSTVLSSVTFDEASQLSSIGNSAFTGSYRLSAITIPESVTTIGSYAFWGCNNLLSINIPSGVTGLGAWVFSSCIHLPSIEIPNSVTSIAEGAFYDCTSLSNITIPNSVTVIGANVFRDCSGLTSVTLPNNITEIKDNCFRGCKSLPSITIPESVTSIGFGAFENCIVLTNITIPSGVTSIGNAAFEYCSGLTSVTCLSTTPPTLGHANGTTVVFDYTNNCPIYVPSGSVNAYKTAEWWTTYADRIQAIT